MRIVRAEAAFAKPPERKPRAERCFGGVTSDTIAVAIDARE
jgi:hypothetical protein